MTEAPQIHGGGFIAPSGRKLEGEQHAPGSLGTLSIHRAATKERLELARANFIEAKEKDFAVEGNRWTDKATGTSYSVVRFDPLAAIGHDVTATGVSCFVESAGFLLFLRPSDWREPGESKTMGSIGGRRFGPADAEPRPGTTLSTPADGRGWLPQRSSSKEDG